MKFNKRLDYIISDLVCWLFPNQNIKMLGLVILLLILSLQLFVPFALAQFDNVYEIYSDPNFFKKLFFGARTRYRWTVFMTNPPGNLSSVEYRLHHTFKQFCFDTNLTDAIRTDLDNSNLHNRLRQKFVEYPLPSPANIYIENSGREWLITDSNNDIHYMLERNGSQLEVYRPKVKNIPRYLFGASLNSQQSLNQNQLGGLGQEFENNDISLSAPVVQTVIQNSEWQIIDGSQRYTITVENQLRISGPLFFYPLLNFQQFLNQGQLPHGLKQEFVNNNISLSAQAVVQTVVQNSEWQIIDGSQQYTIKVEDQLGIYEIPELPFGLTQIGWGEFLIYITLHYDNGTTAKETYYLNLE